MENNIISNSRSFNPIIVAVLLGGALYIAGQYVGSQPQRIEQESRANREIQVQGSGSIEVRPDIAMVQLGVKSQVRTSATEALNEISTKLESVTQALKESGIADDDLKTSNFTINPVYDYQDGRTIPRGYEASETLQVKIRNLDNVGQVLSRTTVEGVNQVGGLTFVSDNGEDLRTQAEAVAIADARAKAEKLAESLGVRLGEVKSYSASTGGPEPLFRDLALSEAAGGSAPPVPAGTQETTATVNITYEIK